jgi:hypothetical protein
MRGQPRNKWDNGTNQHQKSGMITMKMGWLLSRQEPAGYGSMGRPSLAKRLAMTCKTSSLERINIIWAIFAGHKPHNFEMWILCESWYAVESAQKQPISTHINLLPLGLSHIK